LREEEKNVLRNRPVERRAFKRINVELKVNFFYGSKLSPGTVTNFSENGMCMKTETRLACGLAIELFIFSEEEVLSIPVRVNRLKMLVTGNTHDTLGVEVINPTKKYLKFVNSFSR
jgi:hypothetical protein